MEIIQFSKPSEWQQSFRCHDVKCLIVCRGPIRKEAMEVFDALGAKPSGILLSDKDSIAYPQTVAPEMRLIQDRQAQVHHVSDYTGASKEERSERIQQIIQICHDFQYTHVFAGYGFMAEDAEFIASIEQAGLRFVGLDSQIVQQTGAKDEAKLLARSLGISVTPGVDNITALTLLAKAGKHPETYLRKLIREHDLGKIPNFQDVPLDQQAEQVLQMAYQKHLDLFSLEELQAETERQAALLWEKHPGKRIRLKHIGGGGGKGQRVIQSPEQVRDAVMEVLLESKATAVGDNKNFLMELNIENTRHNEIQLLGNGEWCLALGGRDCSLQMHDQKLTEISLTHELLEASIAAYDAQDKPHLAQVIAEDLKVLDAMCSEAERFGEAVGLDSTATFECIVEDTSHYFMEVNTRIQVEHRVTEMAYALKFTHPEDPEDFFILDSLVGAMLLVACHGKRLPRPERLSRYGSGTEVRVNATDAALKPAPGGIVLFWSPPLKHEIRDDQGIGIRNPDTGIFMPYRLSDAYDSNVALIVTHGSNRQTNLEALAEILRQMEVRGDNVHLNLDFHYGLLHWLLSNDAMVKPNTRFVQSYLAMVGHLGELAESANPDIAWELLGQRVKKAHGKAAKAMLDCKHTLLLRPLKKLLGNPHLLAGWLASRSPRRGMMHEGQFQWLQNPLEVLNDLYHYLRLEDRPNAAPVEKIWEDDLDLLTTGLNFYRDLRTRLKQPDLAWNDLETLIVQSEPPHDGIEDDLWSEVQATHRGFQLGMELLTLPVAIAREARYYEFRSNDQLTVDIPETFQDPENIRRWTTALAPPPKASGNQILSPTGGTFFSKETPESEPYIAEGQHFEEGDILGILEVMKMFNPIYAEFSGTVKTVVVDGSRGIVVSRGQLLFEVIPDVPPEHETEADRHARHQAHTRQLLQWES